MNRHHKMILRHLAALQTARVDGLVRRVNRGLPCWRRWHFWGLLVVLSDLAERGLVRLYWVTVVRGGREVHRGPYVLITNRGRDWTYENP